MSDQKLNTEFDKAKAAIVVGEVNIREISTYLSDIENTATLLLAPQSTSALFNSKAGSFKQDAASITTIDESFGIHHNGTVLTGLPVAFETTEYSESKISYEASLSLLIDQAVDQANETRQDVVVGLAIPTNEIINGRKAGRCETLNQTNILTNIGQINQKLLEQGDNEIQTSDNDWLHASSDIDTQHVVPDLTLSSQIHANHGSVATTNADETKAETYAFALVVHPR